MIEKRKQSLEFRFRVWVHFEDGDSEGIEVWYDGLESTKPNTRFCSDWAKEAMSNVNHREEFELDKDKCWQVVGIARLDGWFDYFGEYDEQVTVLSFDKEEVPESFFEASPYLIEEATTPQE